MRLRDVTLVGLRLIAVWIACNEIFQFGWTLYVIVSLLLGDSRGVGGAGWGFVMAQSIGFSLRFLIVAVPLFIYAPRLADWICRDVADNDRGSATGVLGAGSLYHVACIVTGLWFLSCAIAPGTRALAPLVSQGGLSLRGNEVGVASLCQAVIFLVFGVSLIFGSRGLSRLLASLGHDPDNVPAQQFSLRLLLALVIGTALLLFAMRMLLVR
ncbi:MAG: hypothetical protein KJ000_15795 [Pirellulaceae bacterium]|nr:hypothetical protein [Pirellulaceae bacterium]